MSMIFHLLRVAEEELNAYLTDSSLLQQRIHKNDSPDADHLDIDKSWEGILFLLTGQPLAELDNPMGAALFSGQLIDEEQDLGYGPAHYLTPAQVKIVSSQIAAVSQEEAKTRYDPVRMTELSIYPQVWERDGDEILDYLLEYFEEVKTFYATAAASGQAVITFVN